MPYSDVSELPKSVTDHLPRHAQEIYKEAFNSAYEEYKNPAKRKKGGDQEEVAHRVAWNAVKQKYKKGDDEKWHAK